MTKPINLLNEMTLKGTFFGNYKPQNHLPFVVDMYMNKVKISLMLLQVTKLQSMKHRHGYGHGHGHRHGTRQIQKNKNTDTAGDTIIFFLNLLYILKIVSTNINGLSMN